MAKQNKGRKFFATTATAALVATAIAPVAFAAETTNFNDAGKIAPWAKESVEYLVGKGALKGDTNGNFNPQNNLTRAEVVSILVGTKGLSGKVDANVKTSFEDTKDHWVSSQLAALQAFDAEIIKGDKNGNFNPNEPITRQDLAIIISKAYGLELEESAILNFTDNNSYGKEFVSILASLGIVVGKSEGKFEPTAKVTREEAAAFFHRTEVPEKRVEVETSEVKVTSVAAINAKTIEVKFNKAVADTTKATVELLRGTFKQNVTIVWAEDKKSVQLVGVSNFQAADYTVNVTGLTKEVLTNTVKIEAQKVTSIEILDEVAVVSASTGDTVDKDATATVAYVVKDQYGTDISKTVSLSTNNNSTITASNGVVTLGKAEVENKKLGTLVPVVLVDTATGTSVSKTLKLSAESTVSSIAVTGVYNAKGETVALNDGSKANEAFIVLDLKDQYGKEITDAGKAVGLVITNTNTSNLTLVTYDHDNNANTAEISLVEKVKIGDKDKLVIKFKEIKKAGNTDILLISTTNGQSAKYTVQVAETTTTDSISVSQPEIAVASESTLIPITVTDKAGNVITDKKLLSDATKGIKVGGTVVKEADLEVKDGQVYYKTKFDAAGTQALVFQTSTYKVATVTINVKAAAIPTVVRGLKSPLLLSTAKDDVTITAKDHLVIEDQYGRVIANSTAAVKVELVGTTDVLTLANNVVSPKKNGTATLKVSLDQPNGTIDSAVEVKVQVTDGTQYTDYEIAEIGKTQAGVAKAITVNGVLNGGKVALASSEYTATISGGKGTATVADGKVTVAEADLNTDPSNKDKVIDTEFTLKVTVNATGKVLEQKFVVSADAQQVQDFFFTTTADGGQYSDAKAITEATLQSGSTVATELKSESKAVNVATVDQYGNKEVAKLSSPTVTIVPDKAGEVTITGNGTPSAKVSLNGVTESFVTVYVKIGNATKELKVKVVPAVQ